MAAMSARGSWRRPVRAAFVAVVMLTVCACRSTVPHTDRVHRSSPANGTISGTVRGAERTNSLADRLVEIVNLDTGERQRTTTSRTGGFSFNVKPAKYRVEVALNGGESLITRPGVIDLSRKSVDAHADFVVGTGRTTRPRHPHYPADTGLGQPIV
jgi:hypothetical protein